MWHGVGAYLAVVAVVALVVHSFIRRFGVSCLAGAVLSSVLNLVHEAWLVGFKVNLGWGPPLFIVGVLLALPVCLVVGLPFLAIRASRRPSA
jgi:hypothetical protein